MPRRPRTRCCRRAAATVELAICLPILIAVVFGIVEFSRNLQLQQAVRQAAFEGARAGVALDATTADVTSAATAITNCSNITAPNVNISSLSYTSPTITVTVSTTPGSAGWFTWFFNKTSTISASVTLQREVQSISAPGTGS